MLKKTLKKPTYDKITDATFRVVWVFALFAFFQYFLDTTALSGIDRKCVGVRYEEELKILPKKLDP